MTPSNEARADDGNLAHGSQAGGAPKRPASRWMAGRLIWLTFGAVGVMALVFLESRYRPTLDCGPMVQIVGPNQFAVTWSARSGGSLVTAGRLFVSNKAGIEQGSDAVATGGYLSARADFAPDVTSCRLNSRGLFWSYDLVSDLTVRPPAPRGRPFRFLVFGDSGNGSNSQIALADRMAAARADLAIHTGDVIYPAGSAANYPRNLFYPYTALFRQTLFMPSPGNHDYADGLGARAYFDIFTLPENGPTGMPPERNYWFDFGDARFVAIDSNPAEVLGKITLQQMREQVAPWLRTVLSEPGPTWRFVFCHHPPYTGCTAHPEPDQAFMREIFVPVLDETHVDVMFCGHNHLYERSKPIRGGQVVEPGAGTLYIVSGAGGASLYREAESQPSHIETFEQDQFSFTQIDLSPTRLKLKQIGQDGAVIDEYELSKDGPTAALPRT